MSKRYTLKEVEELWPQASAELSGFVRHMKARDMTITASQLEMALQLASLAYTLLMAEKDAAEVELKLERVNLAELLEKQ